MGLYRFQFHECDGGVSDVADPVIAESLADVRLLAVERARAIMAEEVRRGRLCLSCWIVIRDERGANVMTLQFGDAITLADAAACGHETEPEARHAP